MSISNNNKLYNNNNKDKIRKALQVVVPVQALVRAQILVMKAYPNLFPLPLESANNYLDQTLIKENNLEGKIIDKENEKVIDIEDKKNLDQETIEGDKDQTSVDIDKDLKILTLEEHIAEDHEIMICMILKYNNYFQRELNGQ